MPLPLNRMTYTWRRHARSGITVGELLSRVPLRPDLLRIRTVYESSLTEEAYLGLWHLLGEGGAPHQLPYEIPGDRTSAYSVEEVEYVDRMSTYLFHGGPRESPRFIHPGMAGLLLSPRLHAYSKSRAALQNICLSVNANPPYRLGPE